MTRLSRVARRVTLCATLAIVAAMVVAVPMKPATADGNWQNNNQWRHSDSRNNDQDWRHDGYRHDGSRYYYGSQPYYGPGYYYAPQPTYYYQPAPVYGSPGLNIQVIIP